MVDIAPDIYPRSLAGEEIPTGASLVTARDQLSDEAAAIGPLYEAVTGPDWAVIDEHLSRLTQDASIHLLTAKGDDVVRDQATIRVLSALRGLPETLAAHLRRIQEGLSTDG